ncbi:MAG: DUF1080 domain-containing protein [Gammaproteobacteria bacterium]|nr:DUF1080 domain-containing protein [Gammaproteobacteria bacterium]
MKTFVSKKAVIKTLITIPSILVLAACGGGSSGGGGSAATTVTNTAPVITSGTPLASIAKNVPYNFDVNATDIDGDTLVYSLAGTPPTWLNIDASTGVLSGTPDNADVGSTSGIVVNVNDGTVTTTSAAFGITVTNAAPVINDALVPQSVTIAGGMYDFTPTASDVGDTLTYSISGNDSWLSIDANTGQLTGIPMPGDVGTTTVTVTVTDSSAATDTLTFDLVVANGFNEALYSQVTPSPATSLATMYEVADGIATNGWTSTGATPFMDLALDTATELHRIDLRDLPAIGDQVTAATITFMNNNGPVGSPITTGALTDDGSIMSFAISPPVMADNVRITLDTTIGTKGLAEVEIYSALAPGQTEVAAARDLFNTNSTANYTEVEECQFVGSAADTATWTYLSSANSAGINNALVQTGRCRGISASDSAVEGTFFLRDIFAGAANEFDLRLRVRSEAGDVSTPDNENDDSTGVGTDPFLRGMMGIMFNYSDADNYYRYQISQRDGHQKIMKKSGGVYSQLAQSTQSYPLGQWINLRIVRQNGAIIVFQDGEQVLAAADADLNGTELALFCAKNRSCFFDNLIVLSAPSTPIVALSAPAASFVDNDGTLSVSAVVNDATDVGGVQFVLDEGTGSEITLAPVTVAPFTGSFALGSVASNHTVRAYALASDGVTRLTHNGAMDESAQVGVNGIVLLTVGDSITEGLRDEDMSDDISLNGANAGRITSGGYQSNLTDLLTDDNLAGLPIAMIVEANGNETTAQGSQRLSELLSRYPNTQAVLVQYGTNDHGTVLSGMGTTPNVSSPSTYKDFMQIIINTANAAGVKAILSIPIQFTGDNDFAEGLEYRTAITELIAENAGLANPPVLGSDFYNVYTLAADTTILLDDQVHPNSPGYVRMSDEWCGALSTQLVGNVFLSCAP